MPQIGPTTDTAAEPSACLRRLTPGRDAATRLYCFPFAGGSASSYRPMAAALPGDVDLVAFQPPGRQDRLREAPVSDLRSLVPGFARALVDDVGDRPYALFGHSMGAILAYEVAHAVRRLGGPSPRLLAVSGRRAPHTSPRPGFRPYHLLPDDEFLDRVLLLGGIPTELTVHPDLLDLVLPILKADFAAVETYEWRAGPVLGCPVQVFGGAEDHDSPPAGMSSWSDVTSGGSTVRIYSGGHFFLWDHLESLCGHVAAGLTTTIRPGGTKL